MEPLFALVYLALGIIAVKRKRWLWVRLCLVSVLMTFIPSILELWTIRVDSGLTSFLFTALFLHLVGGVLELYTKYNWDFLTHLISGTGAAAAFLVIIATIDAHTETINLSPGAMALVIVMFTMTTGVLWEIGEFTSDTLFGTTEQNGLYDIISDLSNDLLGSLIAALFATLYIKEPNRLVSLDANAITRFYPQMGFMHYFALIGMAIFFLYFLVKRDWVSLSLSALLLALALISSFIRIPLWVEIALFASLLIRFTDGLLSADAHSYPIIFAACGIAVAYLLSSSYVTNPWFFTALIPVASLFLASLFEIARYVSKRRISDRDVMLNFIHTFAAALVAAFSGFVFVIT